MVSLMIYQVTKIAQGRKTCQDGLPLTCRVMTAATNREVLNEPTI